MISLHLNLPLEPVPERRNISIPGRNVPGFRTFISDRLQPSLKEKNQRLSHFDFNMTMSPISDLTF